MTPRSKSIEKKTESRCAIIFGSDAILNALTATDEEVTAIVFSSSSLELHETMEPAAIRDKTPSKSNRNLCNNPTVVLIEKKVVGFFLTIYFIIDGYKLQI